MAHRKELRAKHAARRRERDRVQIKVHAPDVLWVLGGTHVGRTLKGDRGQMLHDHASHHTIRVAVGSSASDSDLVLLLEHTRRERVTLPLVLLSDNAPNNSNDEVARQVATHRVIHLRTLPYTRCSELHRPSARISS